jgi:hypothetical protein
MGRTFKRLAAITGIGLLSVNLTGCIVAAVPLVMAAGVGVVAITGFAVYKTVQTTGGGTMQIAFGSKDAKHAAPPPRLPTASTIAVWPIGLREATFAATLKDSGKLHLMPLADPGPLPGSDADRHAAYSSLCSGNHVDVIFAALDQGQTVSSNMMSFRRGTVTDKLIIEGYGCTAQKIVWTDTMATVIEAGSKPTPQAEIDTAAGQAWGERVLQASSGS